MDVIALHAAGFENAVATLGTAITAEQARIMTKYTKKVIISYDSDEAGQRAANRAIQLLSEVGLEVRILKMKGAKDPDEFIKKYGADRFRQLIGQSKTGFEYKMDNILAKYLLDNMDEKIKATSEICQIIASVASAVERDVYISKAAAVLSFSTDSLKADVERMRKKLYYEQRKNESNEAIKSIKNYGDRINIDAAKNVAANSAEETILGLLVTYDEYREEIEKGKIELTENDFFTSFGRKVFSAVMELHKTDEGFDSSLLGEKFTPDEIGRITKYKIDRGNLTENGRKVLLEAVERLKSEKTRETEKANGDKFASLRRKQQLAKEKKSKNIEM